MQKQVRRSANKGKRKCDEVQVIERDERNRLLAAVKSPRTDISLESHCVQEAKEYKLLQRRVRSSFVTELIYLGQTFCLNEGGWAERAKSSKRPRI